MTKKSIPENNSIAVVGMNCIYPGAHNYDELWTNILAGRRFFRKFPDERLPLNDYYDPDPYAPGKSYCDLMAVIDGWSFDPLDYNTPPVTFRSTDLVHWLALDVTRCALLDSGIDLNSIDKTKTGVIIGNSLGGEFARSHYLRFRWPYVSRSLRKVLEHSGKSSGQIDSLLKSFKIVYDAPLPPINEDSLAGNMSNTIAGRVCNFFSFGAGGFTVDGACSSSLIAIAQACDSLVNGDMNMAIAGGVDISLDAFEVVGFSKTQALAKDDIMPYDQNANGMITGEGCGMFVLMREKDAVKTGLQIHALVRGWGISSDGAGSMTAPNVEGQMRALNSAYKRADYDIGTVGLFEGHGTGTPLGDRIELTALKNLIDASPEKNVCKVGSIKANIGHCKAAAGSAGIVKAIMSLKHQIIPPTLNCETPNSIFNETKKMRPANSPGIWESKKFPRRASVSAMGFGGSNSHITLEEANTSSSVDNEDLDILRTYRATEIIVLSDNSIEKLLEQIESVIPIAKRICKAELTDLSAELSSRTPHGNTRIAFVTESPWQFHESLIETAEILSNNSDIAACNNPLKGIYAGNAAEKPEFIALFPGQGAQFLNMGSKLSHAFPIVENFYNNADEAVNEYLPNGLKNIIKCDYFDDEADRERKQAELKNTANAQPTITASSIAVLKLLDSLGLTPSIALGHSLGEISALHCVGAYDGITAVKIAVARGQSITKLNGNSGMSALLSSPEKTQQLIDKIDGYLTISNYNAPEQTVVSGDSSSLTELEELCKTHDITFRRLKVSHAFHSKRMQPAVNTLEKSLKDFSFSEINKPMVSSVSGSVISSNEKIIPYFSDQLIQPVKFTDAVLAAQKQTPELWIEIGPGNVLSELVKNICGNDVVCCSTMEKDKDSLTLIHKVVAQAFVKGFPVKTKKLFEHRYFKPFSIDDYNPQFITNPCERKIDIQNLIQNNSYPDNELLPDEAYEYPGYLQQQGDFLKDLIKLDFNHWKNKKNIQPSEKILPNDSSHEHTQKLIDTNISALDYAIDWIAERTGFPKSAIQPHMKLRDDLNLDSIKVGEFVYNVSKKFNKQVPADPSAYANAKLEKLVNVIQNEFKDNEVIGINSADEAIGVTGSASVVGLADWIRTFQVDFIPAPLSAEKFTRLPTSGSLYVLGNPEDPRVIEFAEKISRHGIKTIIQDPEIINQETPSPENMSMLVVILPKTEINIENIDQNDFSTYFENAFSKLFLAFKWTAKNLGPSWDNLRCIVACPDISNNKVGNSSDLQIGDNEFLNAGQAFLKTLRLEHTSFQPKWLRIPESWNPDQWANLIEKELQTSGRRVFYAFAPNGTRYTAAANPVSPTNNQTPKFNSEDVVLCSGGGKGVTFQLAHGIAKKTGAKIALLGLSPVLADDDSTSELAVNLSILEKENIDYIYLQCDIANYNDVQNAVKEIQDKKGNITAVLHGAGITDLHLFREVDLKDFLKVARVKVLGFYNLISNIPIANLKAFHVLTSILGHSGMSGQTDYTMANSWLDGAVRSFHKNHPDIHCLTVGYSIWSETGIGKRIGAVESLEKSGTVPVDNKSGVEQYLALMDSSISSTTSIITGRLNDELDSYIYSSPPEAKYRFLQRIIRYIPETECIVEAVLSHDIDRHLPEHVFHGTPILAGVIAMEAMVEAAQYCLVSDEIPTLYNINFHKAIIIPEDAKRKLQVKTFVKSTENNKIIVDAAIFLSDDNFKSKYLSAELVFGENNAAPKMEIPVFTDIIDKNPGDFSPAPLFQGKFFRRISKIKKMDFQNQVLTEITVPEHEHYYSDDLPQKTIMPYPAARDAFLHSGILVLPPNSLPAKINRLKIFKSAKPLSTVTCYGKVIEQITDGENISNMVIFDDKGDVIEIIEGIHTKVPNSNQEIKTKKAPVPVQLNKIKNNLSELLCDIEFAVGIANINEVETATEINENDIVNADKLSKHRKNSFLAGLIATRRAASSFAKKYYNTEIQSNSINISHTDEGAPILVFNSENDNNLFDSVGLSITDSFSHAIAVIAPYPTGIDIEPVESRDSETWQALLNSDGYNQALTIAKITNENFDTAATRVWSLIESSKKAHNLKRILPRYDASRGAAWLSCSSISKGKRFDNLSATISGNDDFPLATFAFTYPCQTSESQADNRAYHHEFEAILNEFTQKLRVFHSRFANDNADSFSKEKSKEFTDFITHTVQQLIEIQDFIEPTELFDMRKRIMNRILELIGDSEVVKHSIEKPYGYVGDFMLLEKIVQNITNASGLGYYFDRLQLDFPASVACRTRAKWVADELTTVLNNKSNNSMKILDIGSGTAPVERLLLDNNPELELELTAVDIEPAALSFLEVELKDKTQALDLLRIDLRREEAAEQLANIAENIDACIAIGIIEALRDEEVVNVISSLMKSMQKGSLLFVESFLPDHPARPYLEWFMDFHLGYRSPEEVIKLLELSGVKPDQMEKIIEPTGSLGFVKIIV